MTNKSDKKNRLFWIGIVLLIGLGGFIYNEYLDNLPQNYTIGKIHRKYQPPKGNPVVVFKYVIAGKEYENSNGFYGYEELVKVGSTFLVEYPVDHESSGVLLFENPVPSTEKPPYQGWSSKPSFD
jgi:hypothetical protein